MPKKKFRVRHRMNGQNSKGNQKRRKYENASSLPSAPLIFNIPRFSDTANDAVTTTQPLPVSQQEDKKAMSKSAPYNTDTIMSYRGYTLKKAGEPIDYICPTTITPKEFFDKYVKRRRPVVLRSSLDHIDKRWKGTKEKWTNDYLCKVAGESSVRVEYRDSKRGRFGQGKERTMKMDEFVSLIKQGDLLHYLTTQDLKVDEEGRPAMMSSPISELFDHGDFPLRPSLLQNLIPFNLNLWFGNSEDGSSSGLHHDFHDNLYILIRGEKKFRLYSPGDALNMYTQGSVVKVHKNGRINYKGQITRADGADVLSDVAMSASHRQEEAEKDLANAEQALREGKPGAAEWVSQAEKRLDDALDSVLSVQMEDSGAEAQNDNMSLMDSDAHTTDDKGPLNFCKVNLSLPTDAIQKEYPKFARAVGTTCKIKSGEMLYLPAGWFHEVTSYSNVTNGGDETGGDKNNYGGHMAFNYWFHPPDNLDHIDSFESPYESNFWKEDFKQTIAGKLESHAEFRSAAGVNPK